MLSTVTRLYTQCIARVLNSLDKSFSLHLC
jgi:hypothetical protein